MSPIVILVAFAAVIGLIVLLAMQIDERKEKEEAIERYRPKREESLASSQHSHSGSIEVVAGDFLPKGSVFKNGALFMATEKSAWPGEYLQLEQLEQVELATEESVKKLGGSLLWAAAGAFVLGPVGALAGALAGGNKTVVTFAAKFRDGRRFVATTDPLTYAALRSAVM